ncbi:hypothetical protein JHW43_009444 [Diplocarpon mali]|nr:hypothetical protein JHW43_009444 [Diplocarpon mali]
MDRLVSSRHGRRRTACQIRRIARGRNTTTTITAAQTHRMQTEDETSRPPPHPRHDESDVASAPFAPRHPPTPPAASLVSSANSLPACASGPGCDASRRRRQQLRCPPWTVARETNTRGDEVQSACETQSRRRPQTK